MRKGRIVSGLSGILLGSLKISRSTIHIITSSILITLDVLNQLLSFLLQLGNMILRLFEGKREYVHNVFEFPNFELHVFQILLPFRLISPFYPLFLFNFSEFLLKSLHFLPLHFQLPQQPPPLFFKIPPQILDILLIPPRLLG